MTLNRYVNVQIFLKTKNLQEKSIVRKILVYIFYISVKIL